MKKMLIALLIVVVASAFASEDPLYGWKQVFHSVGLDGREALDAADKLQYALTRKSSSRGSEMLIFLACVGD